MSKSENNMIARTCAVRFAAACLALLPLLILSGCATPGVVTQPENKEEIIVAKELGEFLKTTPRPSIVMRYQVKEQTVRYRVREQTAPNAKGSRVRNTTKLITESRLIVGEGAKLQFIKLLQKELIKNGCALHDLTLQDTAGATEGQVDLIVEIRGMELDGPFELGEYKKRASKKSGRTGNLSNEGYKFNLGYNHLEGGIIFNSSGVVCGMFDFTHFGTIPNPVAISTSGVNDIWNKQFPAPTLEESAAWMAKKIASLLAAEKDTKP